MPEQKPKPNTADVLSEAATIFRDPIHDTSRTVMERTWFRNILYCLGEQYIDWLVDQGTFISRYGLLSPDVPTPVTNIIRDYVRSMGALILNKKYQYRVFPNSQEQKDKDAAKLGSNILEWLDIKNNNEIEDVKELVVLWMVLTGNGFSRTYPEKHPGKYKVSPKGDVVESEGDVTVESIIPFNVTLPKPGIFLPHKRWVGVKSLKEREWVEDTFNITLTTADSNPQFQVINYENLLMSLVANTSPWKGSGLPVSEPETTDMESLVLFKEIEYRPTLSYPKGRYVAIAGNTVVINDIKLPTPIGDGGEWYYTLQQFQYNRTPGSTWATSGIDDLISHQNAINEVDQAMATNRKDLGRPYVLSPMDLKMKRRSIEGQNFLQLEYDPISSAGLKPEVHPGTPYPKQIMEERAIHREAAQDAAGDPKNILRGSSPHAGASGVMVDILRESAELSHTPDIDRFYRSWNTINVRRLIIVQSVVKSNRLIRIPGKGNDVLVQSFKGSDLYNNTDVRLEPASGIATTKAGQLRFLTTLIQQSFFGDVSQQPALQYELLRRFGMSDLPSTDNIHRERASHENSIILSGNSEMVLDIALPQVPVLNPETNTPMLDSETGQPKMVDVTFDPIFPFDNHTVHMEEHDRVILSREFKTHPPHVQKVAIDHRKMHEEAQNILLEQEFQQQMQMQMAGMGGGQGQGGGKSGGGESPNQNQNSMGGFGETFGETGMPKQKPENL